MGRELPIAAHKLRAWFRGWYRWYSNRHRFTYFLRSTTDGKLEVAMMNETKTDAAKDPDWVNPANTRKRPFSEEEIDQFVADFILGLDAHEWAAIKSKYGEHEARKRIRASMVKMDENNLANITPKGLVN